MKSHRKERAGRLKQVEEIVSQIAGEKAFGVDAQALSIQPRDIAAPYVAPGFITGQAGTVLSIPSVWLEDEPPVDSLPTKDYQDQDGAIDFMLRHELSHISCGHLGFARLFCRAALLLAPVAAAAALGYGVPTLLNRYVSPGLFKGAVFRLSSIFLCLGGVAIGLIPGNILISAYSRSQEKQADMNALGEGDEERVRGGLRALQWLFEIRNNQGRGDHVGMHASHPSFRARIGYTIGFLRDRSN